MYSMNIGVNLNQQKKNLLKMDGLKLVRMHTNIIYLITHDLYGIFLQVTPLNMLKTNSKYWVVHPLI